MRFIRAFIMIVCFAMLAASANAQDKNISGEFYNIKFPDFVKRVEANTPWHFYYDEAQLDSFTVNTKLSDQSLTESLKQIFDGTGFQFSVDGLNNVFITKNKNLQTTLAADFFNPGNNPADNEALQNEDVKKEKTKTGFTENKLFEIGSPDIGN